MSKLYDMRQDLAAAIIAANIGWDESTVIIQRQTDLWNNVATAMATASNGAVLHIGVAEGRAQDDYELLLDLSLTLTIICLPEVQPDATPEEELWENLVLFIHGHLPTVGDHCVDGYRLKSFTDSDIEADGGTRYLARQSVFAKALYLMQ